MVKVNTLLRQQQAVIVALHLEKCGCMLFGIIKILILIKQLVLFIMEMQDKNFHFTQYHYYDKL